MTLWGVLGIVFAICCWPLGIVFGVLGLLEARKVGKPPTLAYVAFGIIVLASSSTSSWRRPARSATCLVGDHADTAPGSTGRSRPAGPRAVR